MSSDEPLNLKIEIEFHESIIQITLGFIFNIFFSGISLILCPSFLILHNAFCHYIYLCFK